MAKKKTSQKKSSKKKTTRTAGASSAGGQESLEERKARAKKILTGLRKDYADADCALHHRSALELLVATILSAQCTDERVNLVTPDLFEKYRTASDYAGESATAFEKQIQSTGFFRQKTKSIQGACKKIAEGYDGRVPDTMEELLELPGVARKTANVILGTWYGKNEGVVVDTHVGRLAHRMGLTWTSKGPKDAQKIERDLMQVLPRTSWTYFGHAMILHGRQVCTARKPKCDACRVSKHCPSAFQFG